ncbi:MAG TPA: hypothetical protein VNM16_05500 [Bacillota bacterium]|nr:hypothetical protein [Bacillota bacterium]
MSQPSRVHKVATVISHTCNVAVFLSALLAVLAARSASGWYRPYFQLWLLLVGLPAATLLVGIRRGVYTDVNVSDVPERRHYLVIALVFATVAVGWGTVFGLPWAARLIAMAVLVWLLLIALVTTVDKASMHVGGTTAVVALVWVIFGTRAGALLSWTPFVVSWARLKLRRHDLGQVIEGGGSALAAVLLAWLLVRPV